MMIGPKSLGEYGTGDWQVPLLNALQGVKNGLLSALFWTAVVLPAIYIPLLIVGIDNTQKALVFGGLVGLHLFTLISAHPYRNRSVS